MILALTGQKVFLKSKLFSYQYNIPINKVIEAYKQGMFPMAETCLNKEIYWIEPKKRGIFNFNKIKIPKKFKRFLKNNNFRIAIDSNFEQVINNCAKLTDSRKDTWINSTIKKIYIEMHNTGLAHSVECYLNKELVILGSLKVIVCLLFRYHLEKKV